MKIPKKEAVKFVIRSVLHKHAANSQEEFSLMVNRELRKVDPKYSITGKRLRQIAVSMPEVVVLPRVRKGARPSQCPVCGHSLKKLWTKNLKGRKVMEGLRCQKCGYRGASGKWEPGKYNFRLTVQNL
jgi:predicted RNA-binding Zn-ribbon protein involved in translation (DUF1610 family)